MTIDATIQRLTGDGEIIAQFLVDTLQGYTRDATVSHRLKSAEWLTAFGRLIPESAIPKSATIRPRPKPETKPAKTDKPGKKPKVTEKQILHFDIARLIKQETNDGETIIEFLIRVISKIEETCENFTPAVRMRAARELLVRGFGGTIPGVRRILSGKTEDLDSYLSKIVREYTNYGADSIRFLVETMENKDPEAESRGAASFIKLMRMRPRTKPAEGFTASHRVWAACELLRRAYDIKTDHITYEDIQAYWNARTPADARKDDPGSPAASLKGFTPEYLETQAAKMRDADEQPAADANIDAHANEQRDADKQPADANTPSDTPSRAARRREQRAARKAQKRAVGEQHAAVAENIAVSEKSDDEQRAAGKTLKRIPLFPNRRRTREDVAEMLAFKAELESRRPAAFEFQRRQSEKRKAAAAQNIAVSQKSAAEQRDAVKQPASAAEKRTAVAENPDVATEKPANDKRYVDKQPADAKEKRNAVAEKPDADAEKPDAAKQPIAVDKKPADAANPPSANPRNTGRAARRRQKRDARKAEKRAVSEQPAAAANIAAVKEKPKAATEQPAATDRNIADANTSSANPGRAARRREKRAARKAQKRKAAANTNANGKPRSNGSANTPAANEKNGKPQAIHATNGKTPEGAAAIILDSEPLSIEEWKRLRKTLARPDNIPANARSP